MLAAAADRPALSAGTPEDARRVIALGLEFIGVGPAVNRISEIRVPTRHGSIGARLYSPSDAPKGLIVFLHGGGWVVGTLDSYDALSRVLAKETGCSVLVPDYRLAPENPFPAGLEDCEDAIEWASENVAVLAGCKSGLVVMGDSAGGNLATAALRRLPQIKPCMQMLLYPVTDCDFTRESYQRHGIGRWLTSADMRWFFKHYAPAQIWKCDDISPIRASRPVSAGARAVIILAEYDVLHDEGFAYAGRLKDAGADVTLRIVPGVTHGFIRLHNHFDVARQEIELIAADIRVSLRDSRGT